MSEFSGFTTMFHAETGKTFGTKTIDGQTLYYVIDHFFNDSFANDVRQTNNWAGPEVKFYNPTGYIHYLDTGWAVHGGGENDTLDGYTLADWIAGGTGDDRLKGLGGRDFLEGDEGNDDLYGGDDADWLYGGSGNDKLYGDSGNDNMNGGSGDDWMNGGAGDDVLAGGLGNDMFRIDSSSNDTIKEAANEGTDTVYLARSSYTLAANVENLIVDANIISTVAVTGNALDNTLTGAQGADNLKGGAGADVLNGQGGNDWIYGGTEGDSLYGGAGNDRLYGDAGDDRLDGGAGADMLAGGAGQDTYVLDDTVDTISEAVDGGTDTVESLLASTTLAANVDNLKLFFAGTSEGYGNALTNEITGSVWNNFLDGGDSYDWVWGSFGNDTVHGGNGNDFVSGDEGSDLVYGDEGDDAVEGGDGVDFLYGGNGNDMERGGNGDDFLYAGNGNDTLIGDAGNDRIYGGSGTNRVFAGAGDDQIRGDIGADVLWGEAGADKFIFTKLADSTTSSYDRIMDFTHGSDKIDLSGIDAETTASGNQAFHWAGAQPMFGSEGDLFFRTTLAGSVVEGDVNGDGVADFRILISGVYDMQAADFIL